MDTVSLKSHIFEENKVEHILEELGCHNIKYNEAKEYYSAAMPDGDNPMGCVIYNNKYLRFVSYSRGIDYEDGKDIIDLVQYIEKVDFVASLKWLHKTLGIEFTPYKKKEKVEEKPNPLSVFTKVLDSRRKVDVSEIQYLDEDLVQEYTPLLHEQWYKEDGIMPWTRDKFNIGYDYKRHRITIPHYYWMTNDLVGFNQRSTLKNCSELGIPKYVLTSGMDKGLNIYGYTQNKDSIEQAGYCVLFEGEKSVLKRDSRNDPTGLALSGKSISEEQVKIVLSLDISEVCIAMDQDVSEEEIWSLCEKFFHLRKVSYIYDKWGLLDKKDSPADASNKKYDFLFKYRTVYDEKCHQNFLKSVGKR